MDRPNKPSRGLHAHILNELGSAIASSRYAEGVLLPREAELQEHFQASRQTVREAIKVLSAKGMVYARKRTGTSVQPRTAWNLLDPDVLAWHAPGELPQAILRDFVEMRRLIEPAAARFAAQRSDNAAVERIGAALARMHDFVGDPIHFYEADIEFHLSVFAASRNGVIERMSAILRPLLEASFRLQSATNRKRELSDGYGVHEAVFKAIEAKDPEGAATAMERLLDRAVSEIWTDAILP